MAGSLERRDSLARQSAGPAIPSPAGPRHGNPQPGSPQPGRPQPWRPAARPTPACCCGSGLCGWR